MAQKLFFFFWLLPFLCAGQQKDFYNKLHQKVDSLDGFDSYEIVEKQTGGKAYVRGFRPNDSLLYEGAYSLFVGKETENVKEGLHKYYRKDGGELWYTENYKEGLPHGELRSYYPGGKLKRLEKYEHGKFVSGACYTEDGSVREFTRFQQAPSFPGGEEALSKYFSDNLKYPKQAKENGIQGSVVLTFVVNKDGSVSNVNILKDPGGGCGQEAFRLMQSMPNWAPGLADDIPVKVRFTLPLKFKLDGGRKKKRKKD